MEENMIIGIFLSKLNVIDVIICSKFSTSSFMHDYKKWINLRHFSRICMEKRILNSTLYHGERQFAWVTQASAIINYHKFGYWNENATFSYEKCLEFQMFFQDFNPNNSWISEGL